jgi:predicted ATP-grasp superfamily ATP-dependent carboligase
VSRGEDRKVAVNQTSADNSNRASVLLTDGEARATLATTRSLGRAGYVVHVASTDGRSLAGASRYCQEDHAVGNPEIHPTAWARRIESLAVELAAHVLPVTEIAIGSLFAARCEERLDLVTPSKTDYEAAIDKYGLVERALRIGIDVPTTTLIERLGALEVLPASHVLPIVFKPRRSRMLSQDRWYGPPVRILRDTAELRSAVAGWLPEHGDTLLQEFVPGSGEGLFALCQDGKTLARFAHRRLREKPPLGGVSVLRESIDVVQDVSRASELLLADIGFSGIAMVEFRRAPDGRLVLMEINPRPWGSMQLAIDSGVDFPRLMVEAHEGVSADTPIPRSRIGVRTRWLLGDVDHWITCARSLRLRRQLGRSLTEISFDFLRSFVDGSKLEILRARDPRPFGRELRQWLTALWRE